MTKHFKKTKNFDRTRFMQDMEREMIEEEEGDIFTLSGIERARESDGIEDWEDGFMSGYIRTADEMF